MPKSKNISTERINNILEHYVMAALWSTNNPDSEDEEFLDENYSIVDIDDKTLGVMRSDIKKFISENYDAIEDSDMNDEQLGHDLWLTRNGHGAGFFDRGYDKDIEDKLEESARKMKGVDLEVGDDGKIHQMGVYAKGGSIGFVKTSFNSHENHNPEYDILEGYLDKDSFITYAVKVKGDNAGKESMEYYSGENYVVGSKKKSSSRHYESNQIPEKYKSEWLKLKELYETKTYAKGGGVKDNVMSDKYITHIYSNRNKEKAEALKKLTIPYGTAFGNVQIDINDVFVEEGDDSLKYKNVGYGGVTFMGNINGKTAGNLFYKNHEIKKEIENLIIVLQMISDETQESIKIVHEQHGQPRTQHAILSDLATKYAKGGSVGDISFKTSNLYLVGFAHDINGNHIVKVTFPNQKAFSIQTNGVLPHTNKILRGKIKLDELELNEINLIEKEVNNYVKHFGSDRQKKLLKLYGEKFKRGGSVKSKNWIAGALSGGKNKGALKRTALRKHLVRNMDENLSMTDLHKLEKVKGITAKRARLAETLRQFEKGGRLTTNDEIIESFLTSNKEVKVGNLETHFNEYDKEILLRNYGTLIATRKSDKVKISSKRFSKTTSIIQNKIEREANALGLSVSKVEEFKDGGEMYENGGGLVVKNSKDLEEVAEYMTQAVKQTPSKKYPRFWDLKDLITHFENENGFDYKVRMPIWEEMNGYEMKKSYGNILKLLKAIVEANNGKKFKDGGGISDSSLVFSKNISLGKIDYNGSGRKVNEVTISVSVKKKDGVINYETLKEEDGLVLSITGDIWNSRHTDIEAGGQIYDEINRIFKGNKNIVRLVEIWKEYHLNDLKSGTKKQEDAIVSWEEKGNKYEYTAALEYLESIGLDKDNGYEYGSGWLYQPIPKDVLIELKDIVEELSKGKMADGGSVGFKNQYKGHTAQEVWDYGWSTAQRNHFLLDHSELLDKDRHENNLGYSRTAQKDEKYLFLTPQTKKVLEAHVESGQYKKGGSVENEILHSGRYLTIERMPFEKGNSSKNGNLKIVVTPEGLEEITEGREDEKSDEDIMSDLFEDIQSNSELMYLYNISEQGLGMTDADGITDGYYYSDEGEFTSDGHEDAELYYNDNYAIRSIVDDLVEKGYSVLQRA